MIGIIDYGMGNIHSVQKALESLGGQTIVTNQPEEVNDCAKVVLPGVGAFSDAMLELEKRDLIPALKEHIRKRRIFLGICLGMQLLFAGSEEAKGVKGLGVLKGAVKRFENKKGLKVPHMGWNQLKFRSKCPLFQNIEDNAYVYFCHSYYAGPEDKGVIAASTDYGRDFTSIVWQENVYGVQFHPEKSQAIGLQILKNFISL
ncbi:MAG: imidazole glycerol phosphate synthase subunit HisH [Candidatus Omnitrophota bacterium]|jgi:glutamine amidotransferase